VVRARPLSHTKWATGWVPKCTSNGLGQNSAHPPATDRGFGGSQTIGQLANLGVRNHPPTGESRCVQNLAYTRRRAPALSGCPKTTRQLANLGVSKTLPGPPVPSPAPSRLASLLDQAAAPKAHPANWRARWAARTHLSRAGAQVPRADWRVIPTARHGPRGARPSTAPLQAPGAAGALDGEVLTNKSSQGRADAQRLVATRLLDRVHDPLGHFSRLQRIYPRAR
jgi:hypothetical protein